MGVASGNGSTSEVRGEGKGEGGAREGNEESGRGGGGAQLVWRSEGGGERRLKPDEKTGEEKRAQPGEERGKGERVFQTPWRRDEDLGEDGCLGGGEGRCLTHRHGGTFGVAAVHESRVQEQLCSLKSVGVGHHGVRVLPLWVGISNNGCREVPVLCPHLQRVDPGLPEIVSADVFHNAHADVPGTLPGLDDPAGGNDNGGTDQANVEAVDGVLHLQGAVSKGVEQDKGVNSR